jgi:acetyl esterase/lipase
MNLEGKAGTITGILVSSKIFNQDFLSLDMKGVKWAMEIYTNGLPASHPSVTPFYSEDLSGLCPILIQSGDAEVVMDDAIHFHKKASNAGNQVELQLYKDMFHVFHTFPHLEQSSFALKRAGVFIQSQITQATRSDSGTSHTTEVEEEYENLVLLIDHCDQETRMEF